MKNKQRVDFLLNHTFNSSKLSIFGNFLKLLLFARNSIMLFGKRGSSEMAFCEMQSTRSESRYEISLNSVLHNCYTSVHILT